MKLLKPIPSTAFVLFAWWMGAFGTPYGRWIFAALCLSWIGDMLLISKSQKFFLAGLVAFLFAHLAFCAAFVVRGTAFSVSDVWLVLPVLATALAGRWILPHVGRKSPSMKAPVLVYMAAITVMTILAMGSSKASGNLWIAAGALLFYVSDLFVAREQFVAAQMVNRAVGLPLYYAAQFLLAWTVAG